MKNYNHNENKNEDEINIPPVGLLNFSYKKSNKQYEKF